MSALRPPFFRAMQCRLRVARSLHLGNRSYRRNPAVWRYPEPPSDVFRMLRIFRDYVALILINKVEFLSGKGRMVVAEVAMTDGSSSIGAAHSAFGRFLQGGGRKFRLTSEEGAGGILAEPSRAEPSRAEPSRAEPSRAEPSRAEPSRAEPSRAEPSRAEPSRAEPSRAEPSRAEPSRAEPSRAEPSP